MNANAKRVCMGALILFGVGGALWHFTADKPTSAARTSARWASAPTGGDFAKTGHSMQSSSNERVLRFRTLKEYEAVSKYGRLPNSLTGVNVNWNIASNTNGKLILTADLAALFEFFLSAHTEEGLATSLGRIEEYLRGLLPDTAASEALDILRAYLAYKQGLTRFEPPKDRVFTGDQNADLISTVADVKAAMNQRMAARRQYLGTEAAEVFFKADEAYDAYTIKRLEADTNTSLSAAERESLVAQAEQLLPEEKRIRVQQERKEAALNQRIAALQAQGGNEEEVRNLRTELYGAQEANRLAVVDQDQAAWMQRLQNYRDTKDNVLRQTALGADAKALAIDRLEQSRFNPEELREVKVLESIRTQKAQNGKPAQPG
ncbi:MAG: lipase secretion chaperone [Pseudomonadota bacterium]